MKEFINEISGEVSTKVDNSNTAKAVKSGNLEVFGTPMMIALMEEATCIAAKKLLDEGETTVGTKIDISHDKASGIGREITAYAKLEKLEGRKMIFSVYAKDDSGDIIGKGNIERFVVISDKFMRRVNG